MDLFPCTKGVASLLHRPCPHQPNWGLRDWKLRVGDRGCSSLLLHPEAVCLLGAEGIILEQSFPKCGPLCAPVAAPGNVLGIQILESHPGLLHPKFRGGP